MSELKAYKFLGIDEVYSDANLGNEYYLKSEADKVIAELKNNIEEQKRLRNMALASVPNVLKVMKIIQHQKHKRCLAMARWCRESLRLMRTYEVTEDFWNLEPGQDAEYFCKKGDFYRKWRKRWLELAEEPTWAKFLQLIHKEAK